MIGLSDAGKIGDHALEGENYLHFNHIMEMTDAYHVQIIIVSISEWIARVEACSLTSNVTMIY